MYKFWSGTSEGSNHVRVMGINGRIILTLKRPPRVKYDPSLRFFFDNFFDVSYSDTNLRDFVTTSVL